jgi:hypothetical protein
MKKGKKEVQNQPGGTNLYLYVFSLLKSGLRPSEICKKLDLKKSSLQYYLTTLKDRELIKKIGYGVWEITGKKEVQKSTGVGTINRQYICTSLPDTVRGHGLHFLLKIPKNLKNWNKREMILKKHNIPFTPLILGNIIAGQKLEFKGRKIWLTNKTIIIYEKASYFADTAQEAKSYAIYEFKKLIKALESYLSAKFSIRGNYTFKVTKQHYALVKNALAKQYDKEGKKLNVYTDAGLWFIIDNSYNLHEAETVHPKTADLDSKKVQDFFNGIKMYDGFTPTFLLNSIGQNALNMDNYAKHLKAHVKSVQTLGEQTKKLVEEISRLGKIIDRKHL